MKNCCDTIDVPALIELSAGFTLNNVAAQQGGTLLWCNLLVSCFALSFDRSVFTALCFGLLLPFVFWQMCIGLVTYCQHTHPDISWYGNKTDWTNAKAYISATAHVYFSWTFGGLFHWIFEHPAHHVDVSIPFYHLRNTQAAIHAQGNELSQKV